MVLVVNKRMRFVTCRNREIFVREMTRLLINIISVVVFVWLRVE